MNCANHPDRERAAFCQNCGKPLCTECIRNLGNSIFCEQCLAAKTAVPPVGYAGYPVADVPPSGAPNPGLAALLGFIPGVGAMYNEQYAKGIVHLVVFAVLVSLASDVNGIFGLFIAGWVFYMVIEAHHTARARRDGTPLPNPFGLNDLSERLGFGKAWPTGVPPSPYAPGATAVPPAGAPVPPYGSPYAPPVAAWGAPQDQSVYGVPPIPPMPPMPPAVDPNLPYYRRIPSGALWLIGLGLFFLLGNTAWFHMFNGRFFGPLLLIGIGVWIFVRKMTSTGHGLENDGTPLYQWRFSQAIRSSFWVALTGFAWLLRELEILRWGQIWPIYLIAAGLMLFVRRAGEPTLPYGGYPPPQPGPPVTPPVTSTEMVPTGTTHDHPSDGQEGR